MRVESREKLFPVSAGCNVALTNKWEDIRDTISTEWGPQQRKRKLLKSLYFVFYTIIKVDMIHAFILFFVYNRES